MHPTPCFPIVPDLLKSSEEIINDSLEDELAAGPSPALPSNGPPKFSDFNAHDPFSEDHKTKGVPQGESFKDCFEAREHVVQALISFG